MSALSRVEWTGTLRALSPLAVGGGELGDVDLAPVLDGADQVFLPGTSLTGVLRSFLTTDSQDRFGSQDRTSTVEVDDAPLLHAGPLELRDGVGINRMNGAASHGVKYTRLVVPTSSAFAFRLTAEVDEPDELNPLIALLTRPEGVLVGGASSRGLGRVRLDDPARKVICLDRAGVLEHLAGKTPVTEIEPATLTATTPDVLEVVEVPWTARGPVFVKAGTEGLAVDDLPLVSRDDDRVRLVIPGSSTKGVLRSHAERIERTVRRITETPDDFLDQVNDPRLAVTARLFGTARPADGGVPGRRSAIAVDDCLSGWSCTTTQWDAVAHAASQPDPDRLSSLREAVEALPTVNGEMQIGFHVGLDRWTSAPVDGALYSVLEPWGVKWEPLRLRVDHRRLGDDNLGNAAGFLLLLVLRDLCEGYLGLGFGAWRGYGCIGSSADEVELTDERWGSSSLSALLAEPDNARDLRDAWIAETEMEAS